MPEAKKDLPPALAEPRPAIAPAARRALAEARERRERAEAEERKNPTPTELGGRVGPDPTRFNDYEKKGLAIDF